MGRGRKSVDEVERVLGFWLGEIGAAGWYAVDEAVDRRCADEFGGLVADALAGRLAAWQASPGGALALLILLDQLPRNAFRGTAGAHAGDGRARAVAKAAIARSHDLAVPEPERQFFYLPLMHSESPADQHRCVRLVLMRLPETGADNRHHGILHREVIRRFGRFPSRNRALGRPDTEAERAYRAARGYMA
jgi:uncharacterized protein (DUF924 family)